MSALSQGIALYTTNNYPSIFPPPNINQNQSIIKLKDLLVVVIVIRIILPVDIVGVDIAHAAVDACNSRVSIYFREE